MKKREELLEEMDDTTPKLVLLAGGTEDPNWLIKLKHGAIFTCRHKPINGQRQPINEFEIVGKERNGDVKLFNELADISLWVDSLEFSRAHDMRIILCEGGADDT